MAAKGWSTPFEDPIPLPRGGRLVTLRDAADYILKLPKAEQNLKEWQAATEALIMAAEDRGPSMHARVGMLRAGASFSFPQCPTVPARYHGGAGPGPLGWVLGRINMTNWKADLEALVEQTMAFTKSMGVERPMPRTIIEPNRIPPVNLNNSEREEIRQRVANFKAHQERFAREREDFAAFQLKRILGQS